MNTSILRFSSIQRYLVKPCIQRHCAAMSGEQQPVPGTLKDGLKDGWFTELSTMWPGQGMSFKVNEVIHTARSDFQVRPHAFHAQMSSADSDRIWMAGCCDCENGCFWNCPYFRWSDSVH